MKRTKRVITRRTVRFFALVGVGLAILVIIFGITQSTNKIHMPLSPSVKSYDETILKLSKEYGIESYAPLVSAVMISQYSGTSQISASRMESAVSSPETSFCLFIPAPPVNCSGSFDPG